MSKDWTKEYSTCFSGKRHCFHNGFRVFISNLKTTFPPGDHSHDEYEFICFKNNDIITFYNGKNIPVKKGYFFPFNSLDAHGQAKSAVVDSFLCLLFAPEIIENAAKEIFGFKGKLRFANKPFLPSSNLNYYLGEFANEYGNQKKSNNHCLDALQRLIVIELLRCSENNVIPLHETNYSILRAQKYIHENADWVFNLQKVAEVAGMNKYYFVKKFTQETGLTPHQYAIQVKIEHAKAMIADGKKKFTEIAYELGYSTQAHFSAQFKKHTGITAREYKKTLI